MAGHGTNERDLRAALARCVRAMKLSIEAGCTDHLDACDDAGAFWHDAIAEAEMLLGSHGEAH